MLESEAWLTKTKVRLEIKNDICDQSLTVEAKAENFDLLENSSIDTEPELSANYSAEAVEDSILSWN